MFYRRAICAKRFETSFELILDTHLFVERAKVIEITNSENSDGQKVNNACYDLSEINTVDTKESKKDQQDPSKRVIATSGSVFEISFAVHSWNQKQINEPTNSQKP